MAQDARLIDRLARELAELAPDDRARVVAEAVRLRPVEHPQGAFSIPTLAGGTAWIGGDLRREDLYGGDGR
jgi:hypothetical protein